ncbi:unnamed protein product, partial [Ixodes pacificus]
RYPAACVSLSEGGSIGALPFLVSQLASVAQRLRGTRLDSTVYGSVFGWTRCTPADGHTAGTGTVPTWTEGASVFVRVRSSRRRFPLLYDRPHRDRGFYSALKTI